MKRLMCVAALVLSTASAAFAKETKPLWLRYPAISPDGKEVAFTYKGDIYKVSTDGGEAVRLTTHYAYDSHPIWSPDGKHIAFVSDRNEAGMNIYIMPSRGGAARQLTTHSSSETPYTFTPDGKAVIFKAHYQDPHTSALFPTARLSEVYSVPVTGGRPTQILATPAEYIAFSHDGKRMLYQNIKGFENEWRKRHTSSVSRDILEYDFQSGKHRFVVEHPGEDLNPIYSPDGTKVYFISQRNGGDLNVYEKELQGDVTAARALTQLKHEPVRFLSMSQDGLLCFSQAGELYTLRPGEKPRKIALTILNDRDDEVKMRSRMTRGFSSADVSADGKQLAYVMRGDVFVTSVDHSSTKRITNTASAEAGVTFGSDGRTIVYAANRDGKWDLYQSTIIAKEERNFPNATLLKESKLIPGNRAEKMHPAFSPDGTEVAFVLDRKQIAVYNIKSKELRTVTDKNVRHEWDGSISFEWSPDGKWFVIEYVARNHAPYSDIGIVSAKGDQPIINITNTGYFDANPHWVLDGNAILFTSERFGMRNHASWGSQGDLFAIFLNREAYGKFKMNEEEYELFTEEEKEASAAADKEKKDKNKKDDKSKKEDKKEINIEWQGIEDRIVRLTPNSSDVGDAIITKDGKKLYYQTSFEDGYDLWSIDLRKGRTPKLVKKMGSSASIFKMDKSGTHLYLLGSTPQRLTIAGESLKPISISAEWTIDAEAERAYMYSVVKREEALRFYDKGMHGVDWDDLTSRYERYLPHISNNYDFAEMLSELLGELNVSHTGSGYRGMGAVERTAELGLFLSEVGKNKDGLRIDEVVEGGPFDTFRSKVKAGDIIEAIDGEEIKAGKDYFPLLNGKVRKLIAVALYSPATGTRWVERIKAIDAGTLEELLYKRWIKQRAAEVDRLSNGQLGYVHVPSMGDESFRTLYADVMGKYYNRKGIVIDIRYNGGGRLHEDLEVFFNSNKYLQQTIRGVDYCEMPSRRWNHGSVMVMCEADYSNAHGSPWVYKHLGIGKLVGMPVPGTMTSVNWVTLQDPTLHFGIPAVGYKTAEGYYLENFELQPDVKVSLDYLKALKGEDTQMEAAVKTLLSEVK